MEPTYLPTEAILHTSRPTNSPKEKLTNYTTASNPYLSLSYRISLMDLNVRYLAYLLSMILCVLVALSLMIDLRLMGGMAEDEKELWVLFTIFNYPAHFHWLLLAINRESWVNKFHHDDERKIAPSRAKSSTVAASDEVHRTLNKWVAKIPPVKYDGGSDGGPEDPSPSNTGGAVLLSKRGQLFSYTAAEK